MKKHLDEVDLIYYTGDIIDHSVWDTSQESNLANLKTVFGLIKKAFPGKQVIPIPGNHESHPVMSEQLKIKNKILKQNFLSR